MEILIVTILEFWTSISPKTANMLSDYGVGMRGSVTDGSVLLLKNHRKQMIKVRVTML